MTIQRQYNLPTCNLIVEGLSTDGDDALAPLSVLMNVECYFPKIMAEPLTGGREFLDSLVVAVSRYAQHLLSGIALPPSRSGVGPLPLVDIKPGTGNDHHLLVRSSSTPAVDADDVAAATPQDIKLTTIQFFDLMEAIDQLVSDPQTLPDLSLPLQPLPRRLVKPAEPVAKRAAPAVLGASALAAAAVALFFVPPPKFEPSSTSSSQEATSAVKPAGPDATPTPDSTPTPTPTPDATTTPVPISEPTSTDRATAGLDQFATAPPITNADTLKLLQTDLERKLDSAWSADPAPAGDLVYRIAVSAEGDILGYKYENDLALKAVDTTPLPKLVYMPVDQTQPVQEPVAQFRVTFAADGAVSLVPVGATAASPDDTADRASATEGGLSTKIDIPITDGSTIRDLNATLYDTILDHLEPFTPGEEITYRVRLTESGEVVGYESVDVAAKRLQHQTPLPDLVTTTARNAPEADFMVVFTEKGVLQVSPWDGWPN